MYVYIASIGPARRATKAAYTGLASDHIISSVEERCFSVCTLHTQFIPRLGYWKLERASRTTKTVVTHLQILLYPPGSQVRHDAGQRSRAR
jgi:hypothetical protein